MQRIKAFYNKELSKTDDAFDILYIGMSILENDFIDVKTWAKELFMLSLIKADNASDFFDILQIRVKAGKMVAKNLSKVR